MSVYESRGKADFGTGGSRTAHNRCSYQIAFLQCESCLVSFRCYDDACRLPKVANLIWLRVANVQKIPNVTFGSAHALAIQKKMLREVSP